MSEVMDAATFEAISGPIFHCAKCGLNTLRSGSTNSDINAYAAEFRADMRNTIQSVIRAAKDGK